MNTENLLKRFEQALKENNTALIKEISSILERASAPQYGTISILGREHKTVIIGHQEWMAENLFCPELGFHYDNDPKNSENGYGTLHAHYAMPAIHEILPADGWRVSSDEDWDVLIKHVGPDAGMKLKSKTGWKYDGNGTDEYGFRALPAGYRNYNGSAFHSRGVEVILWSSSANSTTHACRRALHYNQASAFRDANDRSYGFSVRCIRDIK